MLWKRKDVSECSILHCKEHGEQEVPAWYRHRGKLRVCITSPACSQWSPSSSGPHFPTSKTSATSRVQVVTTWGCEGTFHGQGILGSMLSPVMAQVLCCDTNIKPFLNAYTGLLEKWVSRNWWLHWYGEERVKGDVRVSVSLKTDRQKGWWKSWSEKKWSVKHYAVSR